MPPAAKTLWHGRGEWAQIAAAILFGPWGVVFATPMAAAAILAVQILYLREGLGDEVPLLTES